MIIGYIASGLFGALVGSFLNVCIYRLPRSESVVWPSSRCPKCQTKIKPWHNIPIVSFLWLKGKCANCHKKISIIYPLVELITLLLSIACFAHFISIRYYIVYFLLFVSPMIIVFFIDLEHFIIPDVITIPGVIAGLGIRTIFAFPGNRAAYFIDGLAGAIVGGGSLLLIAAIYEKLRKREGLGRRRCETYGHAWRFFWLASRNIHFIFIIIYRCYFGRYFYADQKKKSYHGNTVWPIFSSIWSRMAFSWKSIFKLVSAYSWKLMIASKSQMSYCLRSLKKGEQ